VRKLVKQSSIIAGTVDIAGGQHYPKIPYKTESMHEGRTLSGELSLEDLVKNLETVTVVPIINETTKTVTYMSSSPANLLVQKLIGNAVTKDGATITSLKDIPGKVQAEVIGDSVRFYSIHGTAVLTPKELSGVAAAQVRGHERNEYNRNKAAHQRMERGLNYRTPKPTEHKDAGNGYITRKPEPTKPYSQE
jgi:hypothetical protein